MWLICDGVRGSWRGIFLFNSASLEAIMQASGSATQLVGAGVCYVTSSTPACLARQPCFHSTAAARGFIAMEINQGYKHPAGHVQVRGSWRGVAGWRPPTLSSLLRSLGGGTCPKKTQAEGKIRTKKLIHKQATQGARTGNLSPSVKPSSLWRQEVARPARTHTHTKLWEKP